MALPGPGTGQAIGLIESVKNRPLKRTGAPPSRSIITVRWSSSCSSEVTNMAWNSMHGTLY